MKKLFLFLILGIALVLSTGCDPINPPDEVVEHTIVATYDANVTISPVSVVVANGKNAILDVITNPGYKSTVKVNGTVVSLISSKLTLSNVTSDMKVEATSRKIKQYTITATIDSGIIEFLGNNGINSPVMVVDSGKVVLSLRVDPNLGYVLDKFKVNGVEKTYTPSTVVFDNVNCDTKVEATTKEAPIDPYFFGIKWRADSIYSRVVGGEEYSLYLYVYYGNMIKYFFSSGRMADKWDGKFLDGTKIWTVDTSTNPNILSYDGRNRKVEVRTNKKLVTSYIDVSCTPAVEFKETYIPEP